MITTYTDKVLEKLNSMFDTLAIQTPNILIALLFLLGIYFFSKIIRASILAVLSKKPEFLSVSKVIARVTSIIINMLGFLVASSIVFPSVTPANLFSLLGVGGVAIGFAFKDIFQNFLAGILILLTRSFKIGDQIEVNDVEGTVEDIEIRATIIRTYDNRKIIIPNSTIFTNKVTVNTAYDMRRISVMVGIGYGDSINEAKKIILRELDNLSGILKSPEPYILVTNYGPSSVDLEVRFWIKPPKRRDVLEMKDDVLATLKPALFKEGIDIPFPTQVLLFHDQTEQTDGNRKLQREGWPSRGENKDPQPRYIKNQQYMQDKT